MTPHDVIQDGGVSRLPTQPVLQGLRVMVAVPHPGGSVPQGQARLIQKRRVGLAQHMPPHPGFMEVTEGGDEGAVSVPVITTHGEVQGREDRAGAWGQGDGTTTSTGFRWVHPTSPVRGSRHHQDVPINVLSSYGDRFTPPQAGEQHEFRDWPPLLVEPADHRFQLRDRQVVLAVPDRGYPGPVDGCGDLADDAAACGMPERGGQNTVRAGHRRGFPPGREEVVGERLHVRGANMLDGAVPEPFLHVFRAGLVGLDAVRTGGRVRAFRVQPRVDGLGDGDVLFGEEPGGEPVRFRPIGAEARVPGAAVRAFTQVPGAPARTPLGARVPATLFDGGHVVTDRRWTGGNENLVPDGDSGQLTDEQGLSGNACNPRVCGGNTVGGGGQTWTGGVRARQVVLEQRFVRRAAGW